MEQYRKALLCSHSLLHACSWIRVWLAAICGLNCGWMCVGRNGWLAVLQLEIGAQRGKFSSWTVPFFSTCTPSLSSIPQLATTTTTPLRRHEWRMVEEEFLVELQEHHKHAHVVTIPSAQHYQIITMIIIIIIYTGVWGWLGAWMDGVPEEWHSTALCIPTYIIIV